MSKGPEQLRLEQAVGEGISRSSDIRRAAEEWLKAAEDLDRASRDLGLRSYTATALSPHTGKAMGDAFVRSADGMAEKARLLISGADALNRSAARIGQAEAARQQMRPLNDPGAAPTIDDPKSRQGIAQQAAYDTALGNYQRDRKHNEDLARPHNTQMDQTNREATQVMKNIHGIPDPVPQPAGRSGSAGGAGGAGATGGSRSGAPGVGGGTASGGGGGAPGGGDTGGGGGTGGGGTGGGATGTPQGGTTGTTPTTTPGTTTSTPALTPAASAGSAGSNLGGAAAAAGGGLLGGAGGVLGGVRSGGAVAMPTNGSSATGGRAIGTTTRVASASTLGRGAGTSTGTSAATSSTSRAGTTGRAAAAGSTAGRGSSARGGATRAGTRAGVAGQAGAVAGPGRRKSDRDGAITQDHLLYDQDWVDDEGAAPQVIA